MLSSLRRRQVPIQDSFDVGPLPPKFTKFILSLTQIGNEVKTFLIWLGMREKIGYGICKCMGYDLYVETEIYQTTFGEKCVHLDINKPARSLD